MTDHSVSYCGNYLCSQCAYHRGLFVKPAQRLVALAQRYQSLRLIVGLEKPFDFDEFMTGLEWLAAQEQPCKGCRQGGGWSWWPDCPIRTCCVEQQVEFCYQCPEFPCTKLTTGPLKDRLQRFVEANRQIEQKGLQWWIRELEKKYADE
jgi:hypothetical protein